MLVWKIGANGTENTIIVEEDLHRYVMHLHIRIYNMVSSKFKWTTAIKVQFNKASTLLMVSGVLKVTINKARMGEIIVYECQGEDAGDVRSRISLK